MKAPASSSSSRREFIKQGTTLAAAGALTRLAIPHVHAASSDTIQLALIGCGGRGSGAAADAFSTSNQGPVKLVAMADMFEHRLKGSYESLNRHHASQMDVPPERRFIGLDAYKEAMDALRPGDVAIFATPPAFRWVHFAYAISKGLNVFMEKPITVDGPTSVRMLKLAEEAESKGLKAGVGLMVRHCRGRHELLQRIRDGQIGDIIAMRGYRMGGVAGTAPRNPGRLNDFQYQIQKFHAFTWASGGIFSDYNIHQIDECSWIKGAWPVRAHAMGARYYRGESVDQNFDVYSVEYIFPDGTRFFFDGRLVNGCRAEFASYAHGAKGSAVISTSMHTPGKVRIYKGHNMTPDELTWAYPQPERNPYQLEWEDLMMAIRHDHPYNEVKRGVEASVVTSMGRYAAHTGQDVTFEQMLNHEHEMAPGLDKLGPDAPPPVLPNEDGSYPQPQPGEKVDREY